MKTLNAIIESVSLSRDNELTMNLTLKLQNGGGVCFGNVKIGNYHPEHNVGDNHGMGNYAAYYITKVFEVADVDSFGRLKGQPVRAIFKEDGRLGDVIIGIQHFLDDTKFFIPRLVNETDLDISSIFADDYNAEQWAKHREEWRYKQRVTFTKKDN